MLTSYMEKAKKLNELVLQMLQKINGEGETPCAEEEGGEHPFDNSKGQGMSPHRVKMISDLSGSSGFITKEELFDPLRE